MAFDLIKYEIDSLKDIVRKYGIVTVSNIVLDNPNFAIWSGSHAPDKHHYGRGGLAIHTHEVVKLCLMNTSFFSDSVYHNMFFTSPNYSNEEIVLAALFHDIGKLWDYTPTNEYYTEWTTTDHISRIHHISRSGLVWWEASKDYPMDMREKVLHAILAHHGCRNYGSPVSPKTKMAWVLHTCDMMSARYDDEGLCFK